MIEELNKIGDINTVGDLLDFKLSIKTLILLAMLWGIVAIIVVVFMFGGVNNTIDYVTNMIESTKKSIVIVKDKKSTNNQSSDTKTE